MSSIAELILSVVGKDAASDVLKGVGDAGTGMGAKVTAGAGVAVAAAAGVGAAFLGVSNDMHKANNEFQVQLGATGEQADRLGEVAKRVYRDNFAGSIEEAAGVIATSFKVIGDVGDEELQSITENALRLQDSFGIDTAESIDAAKTLMENFGLSSQEAFDFVAAGVQKGLNRSGDFLDTIGEYSTQFRDGGASADQFFSLLESGLQGGMLGTDKAADAFKEFRVRILDGSEATSDALESIGLDAEEFTSKIASGEITTAQAFETVIGKLKETDDAGVQMRAGVGLIGTQFEDLGTEAALSLDLTSTKLGENEGAAASLDEKYDTIGSRIEGLKRKAELGLLPMAEHMQAVLPVAGQLGMAFGGLMPVIGAVGPAFTLMSGVAVKALMAMGTAMLTPPIGFVVALVAAGVAVYVFRDQIKEGLGAAADFVGGIAPKIGGAITGALDDVLQFGKDHWPEIAAIISGPFFPIVALATDAFGVRTALTNAFEGMLGKAGDFKDGAISKFGEVIDWVAGMGGSVLNAIGDLTGTLAGKGRDLIQGFLTSAKDGAVLLLNWVFGLPGEIVSQIPNPLGVLYNIGVQIVQGLIDGIKSMIGSLVSAVSGAISAIPDAAKKILGIFSPSRVMFGLGRHVSEGFALGIKEGMDRLVIPAAAGMALAVPAGVGPAPSSWSGPAPLQAVVQAPDERPRGGGGNTYHFYRPVNVVLPGVRSAADFMGELDRVAVAAW